MVRIFTLLFPGVFKVYVLSGIQHKQLYKKFMYSKASIVVPAQVGARRGLKRVPCSDLH